MFLSSVSLQFLARRQREIWLLLTLIVATFFSAKIVNSLIAFRFFPVEFPKSESLSRIVTRDDSARTSIPDILSRNIFDSEAHKRTHTREGGFSESDLRPSTLPIELMGTVVFRNSKYSTALIRDRGTGKSEYYGMGDSVQSGRIVRIERFRVILDNGGRLEFIELKAAESKLASMLPSPAVVTMGGQNEITELEPNKFHVPQSLVDQTLSNLEKVLTQARMVPNMVDNRTDGFRIFQIRPESIFEKMGLKDGDVIKRVNGQDLNSFEKSVTLLTALRNEKSISIDIVRNGTRLNLSYEISP